MSEMRPITRGSSLLERAARAYDFGAVFVPATPPEQTVDPADPVDPDAALGHADAALPDPGEQPATIHADFDGALDAALPVDGDAFGFGDDPFAAVAPRIAVAMPDPAALSGSVRINRDRLAEQGMLVPGAPVSGLAEEFRLVKRQLLNTARSLADAYGDAARLVLVTSANPNEGKTFCAINLALSLAAERDTDVLLVDADFAKPDVMKRLDLADRPGLLDALANPAARIEDYVVPTDVPQLSLLPAGNKTHQDTELLASDRTAELLEALMAANPRRIIVFDSPPVLAASPAATLAHQVGQVMMIVRADRTSDGDLREAVGLLDGCEQIQLVLNAVSFAPGGRRFGSYYGQESPA
jgi:exopolysaccharide/PEP-CTERM locus tyrosine autokinase